MHSCFARRIADPRPEPWRPPLLAIYLSTIELPDLAPGRREAASSSAPGVVRHPTKGKATPVLIAPQPSRPHGKPPHGLPSVRLSPSPEPSRHSKQPSHGKQPSHSKQASHTSQHSQHSQASPPVPPAPGYAANGAANGKLTKPNGTSGGGGVRISRLFKGRA